MYPELYAPETVPAPPPEGKTAYLTFDDGPSGLTIPLLDELDRCRVKATFFLIGKADEQGRREIRAIAERGHAIGVHSYTHDYKAIYANPAAFLTDFARMHRLIREAAGVDTAIYRFAGGSVNSYNRKTAGAIISEMNRRGYVYYDWNVDSGDAEHGSTAQSIYRNAVQETRRHRNAVILFHNTGAKKNTLKMMPKIIETLRKDGYRFDVLGPSVSNQPYIFRVPGS